VTPIIVAAAVAALIVIGACLVLMSRSRRDDEGEQFRRVADLTSRWSRQVQPGQPGQPPSSVSERGVSVIGSESEPASEPEASSATGTTRPAVRTTESVDPT
jgi:hypothetical protein